MTHPFPLLSERQSKTEASLKLLAGGIACLFAASLEVYPEICRSLGEEAARQPSFYCSPEILAIVKYLKVLVLVVGSAFIGGSLSQVVAARKAKEVLREVSEVLQRSVAQPALYSQAEDIEPWRCKLYSYHRTRKDGQPHWRVGIIDFSGSPAINRLLASVQMIDDAGHPDGSYQVEAFSRGSLLCFLIYPSHKEPHFARLYPVAGQQYRRKFWGISTHEDFDGQRALYRSILSREPLLGLDEPCLVSDSTKMAELDREWESLFAHSNWTNRLDAASDTAN